MRKWEEILELKCAKSYHKTFVALEFDGTTESFVEILRAVPYTSYKRGNTAFYIELSTQHGAPQRADVGDYFVIDKKGDHLMSSSSWSVVSRFEFEKQYSQA